MKKLDNKGFTLVELLAVIIILAIVVGITIPAVMTTVNNAKKSAGQSAARSLADWVDRQYQAAQAGFDLDGTITLDTSFTAICGSTGSICRDSTPIVMKTSAVTTTTLSTGSKVTVTKAQAQNFVTSGGLLTSNVTRVNVNINANGRSCVTIYAKSNGDYYDTSNSSTTQTYTGGIC